MPSNTIDIHIHLLTEYILQLQQHQESININLENIQYGNT